MSRVASDPQGRGVQRLLGFWKLRKRDLGEICPAPPPLPPSFPLFWEEAHTALGNLGDLEKEICPVVPLMAVTYVPERRD